MNKGYDGKGHAISGMMIFLLLSAFAILALLIVVLGVSVFQNVVRIADENNKTRASLSYIANKIRAADSDRCIEVRNEEGMDILSLSEMYDGENYETLIYCYDGALRERYIARGDSFDPQMGDRLVGADSFSVFRESEHLLKLTVTGDGGKPIEMHLAMRTQT